MTTLHAYLNFNGNCEEAFNFYASLFGSDGLYFQRFAEIPAEEPIPEAEGNKIMHASLPISPGHVLMGSDVPQSMEAAVFGNSVNLSLQVDSEAEATRLFEGLSAGGAVHMPLQKTFWNATFGMFTDKYGIHWMVNYPHDQ